MIHFLMLNIHFDCLTWIPGSHCVRTVLNVLLNFDLVVFYIMFMRNGLFLKWLCQILESVLSGDRISQKYSHLFSERMCISLASSSSILSIS